MKVLSKWWLLGLLLALLVSVLAPAAAAQTQVTLEVYDPTGAFEVTQLHAPRVADLNGKIVCELTTDAWQAHRTFPALRELLQKQFPTVKILPYTEVVGTRALLEDLEFVAKTVKEKGCQAAIVGNAG